MTNIFDDGLIWSFNIYNSTFISNSDISPINSGIQGWSLIIHQKSVNESEGNLSPDILVWSSQIGWLIKLCVSIILIMG